MQDKPQILPTSLTNMLINHITVPRKIKEDDKTGNCYAVVYDGQGEIKFNDGSSYIGQVENGFLHGQGTYSYQDGTKIKMNFNQNRFTGQGQITYPDETIYVGEIQDGLRHGQGTYTCPQYTYKGKWQRGLKHGDGNLKTKEGQTYDGSFQNDFKEGKGTQIYESGNVYTGNFHMNQKHGYGVMKWKTQEYEGDWQNGQPHGQGQIIWSDDKSDKRFLKNRYQGSWKNGQRHGIGAFYYANGSKYEGQWENNFKHGNALFTDENGMIFLCKFNNDKLISKQANLSDDQVQQSELPQFISQNFMTQDPSMIQSLNNMILRNHQNILQFYRHQVQHDYREEKLNYSFILRKFQIQYLLQELKVFNMQLTIVNINRLFNQIQENFFQLNISEEDLKSKLHFYQNCQPKIPNNYQESYLRYMINIFTQEKDDQVIQDTIKFHKEKLKVDCQDKHINLQYKNFLDYLLVIFYIKNGFSSQNLETFGESLLKSKFLSIVKKKGSLEGGESHQNSVPQSAQGSRINHNRSNNHSQNSLQDEVYN